MGKKRSRSRSRSRSRDPRRRKNDKWMGMLQSQVDNLTKVVETLVAVQQEQKLPTNSNNDQINANVSKDAENKENESNKENVATDIGTSDELDAEEKIQEQDTVKEDILKALGMDPDECLYKDVKYHPQLSATWSKWKIEGLPEKRKKEILQAYKRKGEFYTEAPKLNLEIVPLLSDIAKKRDDHFVETQNCVGTALSALGAAVSVLVDQPEEGVDEDALIDYISHAGQMLSEVFYQQSVARKSYITPQLNKNIKPMVDTMLSNKWLYGDELKDKVKDVKEIEKACAGIKEKQTSKMASKARDQGNWRRPSAEYRQVGQYQRHRSLKFKPRSQRPYPQQSKTSRMTNQSSSKK